MQLKLHSAIIQIAKVSEGNLNKPSEPIKHKPINKKEDKWHE